MRAPFGPAFTALALVCATVLGASVAEAKCKRMGFLVNDYGKDGPTKDAQDLLDKHVAEWAAQNGIAKYTVGKKDVTCELFLNFIVFDEHTCTASANVCWDEPGAASPDKTATDKEGADKKKAVEKKSSEKAPDESKAAAAAEAKPEDKSAAKPAEKASETAAPIETGTLPAAGDPQAAKPASDLDAAERAAAAAERAAAAAERAAAAAEKAAQAANKPSEAPSQLEMPDFGAGAKPAEVAPITPTEPKS